MTCHITSEIKHVFDNRVFIKLDLVCLLTDLLCVCKFYISPTLRLCKFLGFLTFSLASYCFIYQFTCLTQTVV